MSSDRWKKIETLFEQASLLTPANRLSFVKKECGEDKELEKEVLELLEHATTQTEHDPLRGVVAVAAKQIGLMEGEQLGPYSIGKRLGTGGMGDVYLAEQSEPVTRTVALKVIKKGMDTERVLKRFQLERKTLALMDHSGIARIYDAGATPDGRPYFVMELVSGQAVLNYANDKRLNLSQRIALFQQICDAVGHAHHKGVIHRDLKPSNILVKEQDGQPNIKIIDFGIAKSTSAITGEQSLHTADGVFVGTPEYMSPEQASSNGQDLDTRSDLYALGLILFELLTQSFPFDRTSFRKKSYAEMQRIICEVDSPKPSSSSKSHKISPDLDWIVLKALEKDRDRRYSSASELSEDLVRLLHFEPVLAAPPTTFYRFSKFAKRNKALMVGTCSVILALALGLVVSLDQLKKARQAQDDSVATLEFLTDMLLQINPQEIGDKDLSVRQVLDEVEKEVGAKFSDRPLIEARLRFTIGKVYLALGAVGKADKHLDRALVLYQELKGDFDSYTIQAMTALGTAYGQQGKYEQALPLLEKGLERSKIVHGANHNYSLEAQSSFADLQRDRGKNQQARDLLSNLYEIYQSRAGKKPEQGSKSAHVKAAVQLERLAVAEGVLGNQKIARDYLEKAYKSLTHHLGKSHRSTLSAAHSLANAIVSTNPKRAFDLYKETFELQSEILGPDHPETLLSEFDLATQIRRMGKIQESLTMHNALIPRLEKVKGASQRTTLAAKTSRAGLLGRVGKQADSIQELREILTLQIESLGETHRDVLITKKYLGQGLYQMRQYEEALQISIEVYEQQTKKLGPKSLRSIEARVEWGACLLALGKAEEALEIHLKSIELYREANGPFHYETLNTFLHAMHALRVLKRPADRKALLLPEIQRYKEANSPKLRNSLLELQHRLAHAHQDLGESEQASALFQLTHDASIAWGESNAKFREYRGCNARHLEQQKKWSEVNEIRKQAIEAAIDMKGPEGLIAFRKLEYGMTLQLQGEPMAGEAQKYLTESLEIRERILDPKDWRIANVKSLIGQSLLDQNKYSSAEKLLLEAQAGLKGDPKTPKERALDNRVRLFNLYRKWDKPVEAAKWKIAE